MNRVLMFVCVAVLPSLMSCAGAEGGAEGETACDWGSAALSPGAPPTIPTTQEGDVNAAIQGFWQHTYIIDPSGEVSPMDFSDNRFVLTDGDTLTYCQHTSDPIEVGPAASRGEYELDGTTIRVDDWEIYNVAAWSEDILVWDNLLLGGQYVLQRR